MESFSLTIASPVACRSNVTETYISFLNQLDLPKETVFVLCLDGHVDTKNEDLLRDFLISKSANSKIIKNDHPLGYSKTVNRIMREISTDYVLLMDTDVFLNNDCLAELLAQIQDPNVSSVQPVLLYPQNMTIQSYGHIFGPNFNNHALNGRKFEDVQPLNNRESQGLTTACQLFKTKLFFQAGCLDEGYYNAYEGLELSLKFRQLGYKTLVIGNAIAYHFQGKTRKHLTLNESIANAMFWSRWGRYLRSDFDSFYDISEWNCPAQKIIINLSNLQSWDNTLLAENGIVNIDYSVRNRGVSLECWEELPLEFLRYPGSIIFLCDHFTQLNNNDFWFFQRGKGKTLILDLHGNQLVI